jgi:hypothetical protein
VSKETIDCALVASSKDTKKNLQTAFATSLAALMWLKKQCDGDFEKMKNHHSHLKYRIFRKDLDLTDDDECKATSMASLIMPFFASRQQLMNIPIPVWTESVLAKHVCGCCIKVSKSKLKKCSGCENEYYCSAECQKNHWNKHKKVCGK